MMITDHLCDWIMVMMIHRRWVKVKKNGLAKNDFDFDVVDHVNDSSPRSKRISQHLCVARQVGDKYG